MSRKTIFENEQQYHIYNRGTNKMNIFNEKIDIMYFFDSMFISNQLDSIYDRSIKRKNI